MCIGVRRHIKNDDGIYCDLSTNCLIFEPTAMKVRQYIRTDSNERKTVNTVLKTNINIVLDDLNYDILVYFLLTYFIIVNATTLYFGP